MENHPRAGLAPGLQNIDVLFGDETMATVWQTTEYAHSEFGDQSDTVKRAVALGRSLLVLVLVSNGSSIIIYFIYLHLLLMLVLAVLLMTNAVLVSCM